MLGYVTNLQDYQHIVDVCVSCSRREGLPLNIVEAMLSGTPVVATKNRGHNELIADGKSGFLVEKDDAFTMGERVMWLLSNMEMKSRIVNASRNFAERYDFLSVDEELDRIYFPISAQ